MTRLLSVKHWSSRRSLGQFHQRHTMPEAKEQKKPRRWKGRLAKKIRPQVVRPRGLSVMDADTVANANKEMEGLKREAILKERIEKIDLLMKDYGIEEGDYFSLALCLAIDLGIPGFQ